MAGAYADYTAHRLPWDVDGTTMLRIHPGDSPVYEVTNQADRTYMNGEAIVNAEGVITFYGRFKWCLIFPELRDISGYFMHGGGNLTFFSVQWSADTTNGIDGTWTSLSTPSAITGSATGTRYRTALIAASVTGAKALRWDIDLNSGQLPNIHLFGGFSSGVNPDRLELWHPTLDQRVGPAHFDWGNVPRGSSADISFRVKNRSATLTASSVAVTLDAPYDTTPSVAAQHLVNLNGGSFAASQTITSLAPGATSDVLVLRRTTPSNAVVSVWAARLKAVAASWA